MTSMRSFATFLGSVVGLSGLMALGTPREASAQEANGLGEKHELIITADRLLPLISHSSESVTGTTGGALRESSQSGTSVALLAGREPDMGVVHTVPRLAFDFTVINRLTLGGSFVLAFGLSGTREDEFANNTSQKFDTPTSTLVGFAPRVGYVLPLGHVFGFWPRAGVAFYSLSSKDDRTGPGNNATTTTTNTVWSLDLDPQFVWVPLQHFFAHFGPIVNIPFAGSRSVEFTQGGATNTAKTDLSVFHVGLSAGLGGWFDL